MFSKLIPFFKLQMRICNFFFLIPYEWPDEYAYPIVQRVKWKHKLYKLTLLCHWIYNFAMTINLIFTIRNNNTAGKILGFVFLNVFVGTATMRTVFLAQEKDGLNLISSFLRFEEENPSVKTATPDNMGKILMLLGTVTSFGLPSTMMAILFVDPCKPPHLGYILFKTATECKTPGILSRLGLLLFDYFMWTNCIAPGCYYVFEVMFLGLRCMDRYLQITAKKVSTSQRPKSPPAICVLRRFRSNFIESKHLEAIFKYRQIQMLNKKYDQVLQGVFYPSIIVTACLCVIVAQYTCLKLRHLIPMPGLAFFPLLALDGQSVIFIIKVASGVINKSKAFLEILRNNWKYSNRTRFKKVVRSLGKIKVRFGSTNFIDQLTPFIFIDFCMTNTVNVMLIT